jgi:hypothetical protein
MTKTKAHNTRSRKPGRPKKSTTKKETPTTPRVQKRRKSTKVYEVDKILKKRVRNNNTEYLVSWVGYPNEDTWEPKENLNNCEDSILDFEEENDVSEEEKAPKKRKSLV